MVPVAGEPTSKVKIEFLRSLGVLRWWSFVGCPLETGTVQEEGAVVVIVRVANRDLEPA